MPNYLNPRDIKGLNLEALGCYSEMPEHLTEGFENAGTLKSLSITKGLRSLDGLGEIFQSGISVCRRLLP